MIEKVLLSRKEAAQTLSVSVRTLDNYIALKELGVRRLGKRVLVHRDEIERFARRDHQESWTGMREVRLCGPEN